MNAFAEALYQALKPAFDAAWRQADAANESHEQDVKEAA